MKDKNSSVTFNSGIFAILGIDLKNVINNFLELQKMDTDKIIEILKYSKAEELESPTVNTKQMMCIQELCDRGEEHRIFNLEGEV